MRARHTGLSFALAISSALGFYALALAQPRNIFYVYDDLSRLTAVVDQQGNAATYTYDAVGNILTIQRFDATGIPGAVGITLMSPDRGKVGMQVQLFGKGFAAIAGQTSVSFNGAAAPVTSAAPNRIVTSVPAGATTGPIMVTTPSGSATSPTAFVILGAITVSPTSATVVLNGTFQFEAREAGTPTANVNWAVNGIPGGDTATGTISTTGLYRAPIVMPSPSSITVTAIHKDDRELIGSATVTLIPPQPLFVAARPLSLLIAAPSLVAAAPVSVGMAPPIVAEAPLLSVIFEPLITSVSPSGATPGTVGLTVTLIGSGFSGATGVSFLFNGADDPSITLTDLAVNPDGAQATADISVAAAASPGTRIVRITTPTGVSAAVLTGGNRFTVQ